SVLFWLRTNQDSACFKRTFSRGSPARCSANVIRPVAYPSLFTSCAVPSARFHVPTSDDRLQPPSACCLLKASSMIDACCSGRRSPGHFVEAHRRTTRLIATCCAYSRVRYSRSSLTLFWISGVER